MIDLEIKPRSAVMAALDVGDGETERSLDELAMLLSNLNVPSLGRAIQKRRVPDPAVYLGKGKAEEIKLFAAELGADLLVVDGFLSPTQRSGLGKLAGLEVWDRAFVIMMIFEQRAVTSEARLQVELAMLKYEIPSLKGLGHQMSRLGGGIGTRGPGETEFERHRRKLERRIKFIEKDLASVRARRDRMRGRRERSGLPLAALVGYTNSGKSTMLGAMSRAANIVGEDKLFATLDTVTRRVDVPGEGAFLLSDTVGFIRRLPPTLVEAFHATLEQVSNADLLLLVVDASAPDPLANFETVRSTLDDIKAGELPRVVAVNKSDRAPDEAVYTASALASRGEDTAVVSAASGSGVSELAALVYRRLREGRSMEV